MTAARWLVIAPMIFWMACGQVELPGRFQVETFSKTSVSENAIYKLAQLDNDQLAKAADDEDSVTGAPYKFAHAVDFPVDINKHGEWREDSSLGVRRWRVKIASPGALSLSLLFADFHLPAEAEFYVIGKHRTHGAYTAEQSNMDDRKFAIGLVLGDTAILEYVEPLKSTSKEKVSISLHKVVHGFRGGPKILGSSGSCNIDVACADGSQWANQINSVGIMLTNEGQRFCSGTMVNNVRQDGTQYFLTANHCIITDVSYYMIGFNYQWGYCKSGNATGPVLEPSIQLVQGLKVVSKWEKSDFALLLIKERIPDNYNVFLAGWDQRPVPATNLVGIHHPSGDVKKISTYIGTMLLSSWTEFPQKFHWEVPMWTRGITEPGSSGSAIFNARGLVVGHLHGGQSSCSFTTGYDMYGGIAFDWDASFLPNQRLAPYLNPSKLNVTTLGGISLKSARSRVSAKHFGKLSLKLIEK